MGQQAQQATIAVVSLPASEASDAGWGQATDPGTEPDPYANPEDSDSRSTASDAVGTTLRTRPLGLPGGRVVVVATLLVVTTAVIEVLLLDRIGAWTGAALVVVSVISPLATRAGDRSLPAMMPPLAFLAAVLIAGQQLLPEEPGSWRSREAVMVAQTLGSNAAWVVVATILSTSVAAIGHLVSSHRQAGATSG